MLTVNEMSTITAEIVLDKPPSLTTAEALKFRKQLTPEIRRMERRGLMVDLPWDWADPD